MKYYGYDEFKKDMQQLSAQLKSESPDAIIAISRGGMTIGHFLGIGLGIREVFVINAISYFDSKQESLRVFNVPLLEGFKKILIVDDIVDSGKSMQKVYTILTQMNPSITFKKIAIFYKNTAEIMPDYYLHKAQSWIEFFWEVDLFQDNKISRPHES